MYTDKPVKRVKLKLKWKIFMFLLGFCALLLVILWLFQTVFLDSFYRMIKVAEVKRNAGVIILNISAGDYGDISELITAVAEDHDFSIDISDMNGRSVVTSAIQEKDMLPVPVKIDLIGKARNNGGEFYEYIPPPQRPVERDRNFAGFIPSDQMQSLVYVKIINNGAGDMVLLIGAVISPVSATVETLRYQLYVITGLMVAFSVVLAVIIAKRVSKPIEEISRSAVDLSKGNYGAHFDGKGFREIVQLSDIMNNAAKELGRAENLRRELMANVSHDMRTPLSLIYSYSEMMYDFPDEITREQIQTVMDETKRLTSLVNDVLDISKLEAGMQELCRADFDITESIKAVTERMNRLMKIDGYHINFIYDGSIIVNADEVKINQAFYNLLINAVNYTGGDKLVNVIQTVSEKSVRISVSDSGDGIAEEDLPYIWDRYYRTKTVHKRAVMGTGLGLSIIKKIIELHGGNYGVDSKLGKGSIFWFELGFKNSGENF